MKRLPAVHQPDLARVARRKEGLVEGGVAPTHDDHFLVLEEGGVAGGAVAHAPADEVVLAGDAQLVVVRPRCRDHRVRLVGALARLDAERPFRPGRDRLHVLVAQLGAKALHLLNEVHGEVGSVDALRESGVVLDQLRGRDLPARDQALEHNRSPPCARPVERGRKPRPARADNGDVVRLGSVRAHAALPGAIVRQRRRGATK